MDKKSKKETMYLYIVLGANFFIPLLTIPYLTNTLGLSGFGLLGYGQTFFSIFTFFIEFGFILTGAKSISICYENKDNNEVNSIYSNIQIFKFFIFFIVSTITTLILFLVEIPIIEKKIIIVSLISAFSSILIPTFLFNGISKNSVLAFVTVLIKIIFLVPIFIFINNTNDILLAVIFQLSPILIVGLIIQALIYRLNYAKFSFKYYNKLKCMSEAKQAYENFIASFFTLSFTYLTPLFVKYFISNDALGIYTIIDKLINVLRQLYNPLIQTFFSKASILYQQKKNEEYRHLVKKISMLFLILGFTVLFGNILFGSFLLPLVLGIKNNIHYFLSIAIFTQIIVSIASILVNFVIIITGHSSVLKKVYFLAMIFYFPLIWALIKSFALEGVFFSMLILEFFITLYLFNYCYQKVFKKIDI